MTPPMPQEASMDVNFDLDPIQDTTPTPQFDMEETPQFDLQPKAPTFEPQNTVQEPTFVPQNTENNQEQTQQPMQFEPEKTTPISAQHRENEPQLTSIVGYINISLIKQLKQKNYHKRMNCKSLMSQLSTI